MLTPSRSVGMGLEERTADHRVPATLGYRLQPCRKELRDQVLEAAILEEKD